jgi:hypothetical protein
MAHERDSHIRRQITSLISPQLIRRRGRALGVVQRQRKVANDLLHILLAPTAKRHTLSRPLALLLRSDGKDPNRHRLLLKARAQLGVLAH